VLSGAASRGLDLGVLAGEGVRRRYQQLTGRAGEAGEGQEGQEERQQGAGGPARRPVEGGWRRPLQPLQLVRCAQPRPPAGPPAPERSSG
jgi:hypothetical protein